MLEAAYLSSLSSDLEKKYGGKVLKISDTSTLGLFDSIYIHEGISIYLEAKIDTHHDEDESGTIFVQPWRVIKKQKDGLRQFEVCRSIGKHALVVYCIYYPKIKMSAILPVETMNLFRPVDREMLPYLTNDSYLNHGKGLKQLKAFIAQNRKEIHGKLSTRISQ